MKKWLKFSLLPVLFVVFSSTADAQITGINFQLEYDTSECRYNAYYIINSGMTTNFITRVQATAQYTIVVPAGATLSGIESFEPMSGGSPAPWNPLNVLLASTYNGNPTGTLSSIDNDFYGFIPTISPVATYSDLVTGDRVHLFSFEVDSPNQCGTGARLFINGTDPSSEELGGPNFSHGTTLGSPVQLYQDNSPQIFPPNPVLTAVPMCANGLEIDLTVQASTCQQPVEFDWTGPASYTATTEDVAINPATEANNGTYKVVVTDALGCRDSLEVDAIAKPEAGMNMMSCADSDVTLTGTSPATGTWSGADTNPAGAAVTNNGGGVASAVFNSSAIGTYQFVYTVESCSDTMEVVVSTQEAGPNPPTVNCNLTGVVTLAASGTGTWSVDPSSPGTANIDDPSNPNTTVSGFSTGGTYTLVWSLNGCDDVVTFTVNENCGCPISDNNLTTINPNEYCGNSGTLTVNGATATPAGTYLWEVSENSGAFAAAPGTNDQEDYTTIDYSVGDYSLRRIFSITGAEACSDTSNVVSFSVKDTPAAPADLTATPNPICLGETSSLSVSSEAGATYTWSATTGAGLSAGSGSTASVTPTAVGTYDITVFATVDGCDSPVSQITVTVNPVPDVVDQVDIASTDPTACGAADGTISISGVMANAVYTLSYELDGSPLSSVLTASNLGILLIDNAVAGTYSDFVITNSDGCSSAASPATVTLSDPDAPEAPYNITASPNPECVGEPVTIMVTDSIPGATYTWTASSPDAGLSPSTTNVVTMSATVAGQYTIQVTQTVAGCTSAPSSIGVDINTAPPTPDATTVVGTNPTACGASDGSIELSGLQPFTTYTVNYVDNGSAESVSLSTNASGSLTISDLSEGTYTNFEVVNFAGCSSGVYPGPVSLSDPGSPDAPSGLTAMPTPICLGEMIDLNVDVVPGAIYNWTADSPDAGLGTSTTNLNSMTPIVAGSYMVSVSITVAGCTSPASTVDVEVLVVPDEIDAGDVVTNDPTVCGGDDGSITLGGFEPGITFTVSYDLLGSTVTADYTADANGIIAIIGLSQGSYSNFIVANAGGCSTGPYAGPVVLSDPSTPDAPADLTATPNPGCVGDEVALSVTDNPGATYTWSISPASAATFTSTTNTETFTIPTTGSFVISVSQEIGGCTSAASNITVFATDSPEPLEPGDFTANSPSGCQLADGSIVIGGLDPSTSYGLVYDSLGITVMGSYPTNDLGELVIDNLASGSYSNFQITNLSGCSSPVFAGPISISDPGAPEAPANIAAIPNPACLGETVDISVDPSAGAVFTWSASSPDAGLGTSTTNEISMTATVAGTYTIAVFQTIAGCTSPAAMIDVEVLAVPADPDANTVIGTNPSSCGVADGSIEISGLMGFEAYTINYTLDGNMVSVTLTTDANGVVVISDLDVGTYTDFSVENSGGCASGVYPGPITLVGPSAPDAPTGLSAVPNPICLGETISLSADDVSGATFTWAATPAGAGLGSSTTNTNSMTPTAAGTYNVTVSLTINGCSSTASNISVVVDPLPDTPTAATVIGTDPSGCGNTDGSILLNGYTAGTTYDIDYTLNGDPITVTLMADGNGGLLITGLGEGSYSNFVVSFTNGGCSSDPYTGTITLVEPGAPSAPTGLFADQNPICLGGSGTLTVSGLAGATFNWSASDPALGLGTSTGTTNTYAPTASGTYTVMVTQSSNGCTSGPAMIQIFVPADCLNPDFGVTYTDVELPGDLSTNDDEAPDSTYGPTANPAATNPDACIPTIMPTGMYTFICSTPGEYEYTVDVCQNGGTGPCTTVPLVITVLDIASSENPPVANPDYTATPMDTPIEIEILENDECQSSTNCTLTPATIVVPAANGTFDPTNLIYTPANGFVGVDSFRYSTCQDPATPVSCDEEWVYITVYPGFATEFTNAMDDYDETFVNTTLTVGPAEGVMVNDTDPQGFPQTVTPVVASVPGKGDIEINNDGSYVFTPETDFIGPVDFAYQVCREGSTVLCDSATLHILVTPAPEAGDISSLVWLDSNGNGRYNATTEITIAGVQVQLFNVDFELLATTTTDATGRYTFESIEEGIYFIEFTTPDGLEPTIPNIGEELNDSDVDGSFGEGTTDLFTVTAGQTIEFIKAGYFECVKIGDNVWYDVNKNDMFDDGENGLNGMLVELFRNVDGTFVLWNTTYTDQKPGSPSDDGYFEFCEAPGTYYIRVQTPPAGLVQARPNIGSDLRDSDIDNSFGPGTSDDFVVSPGQAKTDLGAGFYPQAVVGNLVWVDENLDGIQNPFEERLPNVLVQAYEASTNTMLGEALTDDDGIYMIDGLEKKDIYLKFHPPVGMTATEDNVGWNPNLDSDVDGTYGENTTRMFSTTPDVTMTHIDFGVAFSVLPVTWVSVDVSRSEVGHVIEWEVADQSNVQMYEVQRLLDGEEKFAVVHTGIVPFDGYSATYQHTDSDLSFDGDYYYRVKQVDIDGKYSYSDIVSISARAADRVGIYPNPTIDKVNISLPVEKSTIVDVSIYNQAGQLVLDQSVNYDPSQQAGMTIDVDEMVPGLYTVQLQYNGTIANKKFIKVE